VRCGLWFVRAALKNNGRDLDHARVHDASWYRTVQEFVCLGETPAQVRLAEDIRHSVTPLSVAV